MLSKLESHCDLPDRSQRVILSEPDMNIPRYAAGVLVVRLRCVQRGALIVASD